MGVEKNGSELLNRFFCRKKGEKTGPVFFGVKTREGYLEVNWGQLGSCKASIFQSFSRFWLSVGLVLLGFCEKGEKVGFPALSVINNFLVWIGSCPIAIVPALKITRYCIAMGKQDLPLGLGGFLKPKEQIILSHSSFAFCTVEVGCNFVAGKTPLLSLSFFDKKNLVCVQDTAPAQRGERKKGFEGRRKMAKNDPASLLRHFSKAAAVLLLLLAAQNWKKWHKKTFSPTSCVFLGASEATSKKVLFLCFSCASPIANPISIATFWSSVCSALTGVKEDKYNNVPVDTSMTT